MPTFRDPRLLDGTLLALAAQRLRHRQAHPLPDWEKTEGLAAILEYARRCGWQDQGEGKKNTSENLSQVFLDDAMPTTGMGLLLREARQAVEDARHES
jgi:hypothetical protein